MARSLSLSGFGQLGKEPCPIDTPTSWTSRLESSDHGGDLPPEAGLGARAHHCSKAVLKLLLNIPLFLCAFSFLYIQTQVTVIKFLINCLLPCFFLFGHPLSFKSISLPKCLQPFLLHYFQECSEILSKNSEIPSSIHLPL